MDFTKLNARAAAEAGKRLILLDPWTGEELTSENGPCAVIVRGTSSPAVQALMREKQREELLKAAASAKGKSAAEPAVQVMEDTHNSLCESAADFIIGFENIERGETPLTLADIPWLLNLNFPEMAQRKDESGAGVFKDGVPQFEMTNNTFARQILTFAAGEANKLGNS